MKVLYYLMFRIYTFYTERGIERDVPFFYISLVVTILLWTNMFSVYIFFIYFNIAEDILEYFPNKFYVLIPIFVLWSIIYFGIVRRKYFLNYDFDKSVRGGFLVIVYIIFTTVTFVLAANLNRARLVEKRLFNPIKTERIQENKPSLEGKIRKWFTDNFWIVCEVDRQVAHYWVTCPFIIVHMNFDAIAVEGLLLYFWPRWMWQRNIEIVSRVIGKWYGNFYLFIRNNIVQNKIFNFLTIFNLIYLIMLLALWYLFWNYFKEDTDILFGKEVFGWRSLIYYYFSIFDFIPLALFATSFFAKRKKVLFIIGSLFWLVFLIILRMNFTSTMNPV